MELYVVCRTKKEFIKLEAVDVIQYLEKNGGDAVKYLCPFCNIYHISRIVEK